MVILPAAFCQVSASGLSTIHSCREQQSCDWHFIWGLCKTSKVDITHVFDKLDQSTQALRRLECQCRRRTCLSQVVYALDRYNLQCTGIA